MKHLNSISNGLQSVAKLTIVLFLLACAVVAADTSPFASIAGNWNVRFGNGVNRVYRIAPDGSYTCLDVEGPSIGKVLTENGQFVIHCTDGRIQRLIKVADSVMKVEAFADANAYAQGHVRTTGTGRLDTPAVPTTPSAVPAAPAPAPNIPPVAAEPKPPIHSVEEILSAADTTKSLKPFDSIDRDALQQMTRSLQANNGKEIEIEIQPVQAPKRDSEAQFRWQLPPVKSGASVFTPILVINAFRDDAPTALAIVPGKSGTLHGVIQRCSVSYGSGPLVYVHVQASSLKSNGSQPPRVATTTTAGGPSQPSVPVPVAATTAQTGKNISLKTGWDGPMQGGSKTLEDLAFVLNGFAKADPNPPYDDAEIYSGVKYLMQLNEAVAALGITGRLPSMKKAVTPGFPRESLNYTSFDGLFEGHYNRVDIVTDMANQVVCIQFVDEHPKDTAYIQSSTPGNWLTYNFVGYRVKGLTTLNIEYAMEAWEPRQKRWMRERPHYLAQYLSASPVLRVFTYLTEKHQQRSQDRRLEETMWCVPKPFASVILHCISKGQR